VFEIGNSLREARLRQQLEFPEIEQSTKIRAKYLRALEDESFDVLPAQTYVKGFLRTYADYLGLDGQLYVDEYNSRYVVGEDEPPVLKPVRRQASPAIARVQTRGVVVALGAIGIVAGLVIAAFKFSGNDHERVPGLNVPRQTVKQQKPPAATAARPKRRQPVKARLVLVARNGSCWLRVQRGSASGPQVYEGTLEEGQQQIFVAPRIYVRMGNPVALEATLNGKPVALPTRVSGSMIVTARGLRLAPTA
jgi:cytoskeletal protein RodZ